MFYLFHVLLLSSGFGAVGWFLAAIHANLLVWLSLYSLVIYLVNAQQGGVILAHSWVAMVISISAVTRIWPSVWAAHIPYHQPRIWALVLLLIWGIAIALVHLLASSPRLTRQVLHRLHRPFAVSLALVGWVSGAIALGALTYSLGTTP